MKKVKVNHREEQTGECRFCIPGVVSRYTKYEVSVFTSWRYHWQKGAERQEKEQTPEQAQLERFTFYSTRSRDKRKKCYARTAERPTCHPLYPPIPSPTQHTHTRARTRGETGEIRIRELEERIRCLSWVWSTSIYKQEASNFNRGWEICYEN